MGSDPWAQMQVDGLKAADRNGSEQIIHPSQGELAGLKILCSARLITPSNRHAIRTGVS
jgi:hypothetical protein